MTKDNTHDASAQSLGYDYQSLLGLYLLLEEDECSVCIEKFDDISIENSSTNIDTFVQSKCHTVNAGSLYDTSADLWRTIKCWSDFSRDHPEKVDKTLFLIITNSVASPKSIAECLEPNSSHIDEASTSLTKIAESKLPESNATFYKSFLNLDTAMRKKMISHIRIICNSPDIKDLLSKIKKIIRYSVSPKNVDSAVDNLIGWWWHKVIDCLLSIDPVFINHSELENFFSTTRRNFEEELPLTISSFSSVTKEEFDKTISDSLHFFAQLSLVHASDSHIQVCMDDFCHAFQQRSDWVRTGLAYITELKMYDEQLIHEWERYFARMEEDLNSEGTPSSEEEKANRGLQLLRNIEDLSIYIDPKRTEKFIMCGSYQMLANSLRVGWHVDFRKRLK
jgi:hypothetical protein